ncbi:MAG: flagellar motor switch phosphatase FliY [Vampirovibrionales bacterium]|nr:flagellar motor switch phosphatase FliY [Vampirovibrionales bacterium]
MTTDDAITSAPAVGATSPAISPEDIETIRELSNIAFGAAGSNLAIILNQSVDVPSPEVTEYATLADWAEPFAGEDKILAHAQFVEGFRYHTAYLLRIDDAKYVTGLMLGGMGGESPPGGLNEMEISAISEAFSQMLNASAISLASVIAETVEIGAPEIQPYSVEALAESMPELAQASFVSVHYELHIGDGQVMPVVQLVMAADALSQVNKLMSVTAGGGSGGSKSSSAFDGFGDLGLSGGASASGSAPRGPEGAPVTVQPAHFAAFDSQPSISGEYNKNLDLVLDVTLNLTVQLGATELSIKQILELTRGSVIELERIAGEPVDLLANGKLIAKGEVVVIEDNFGLRITSIVSPQDRLRGLTG